MDSVVWIAAWISVWDILRTILEWAIISFIVMIIIKHLVIYFFATKLEFIMLQREEAAKPLQKKRTLLPLQMGQDGTPPVVYTPIPKQPS